MATASFPHCSPGVPCNVHPNSACCQLRLTSCWTSPRVTLSIPPSWCRRCYLMFMIYWLSHVYEKPFLLFSHPITQSVCHHHSRHAGLVPDLLSLRFSSWLAFQTAAFSSCIYNCSVPKKQQQVAAHHSEQHSPQMKIHLFWYSN